MKEIPTLQLGAAALLNRVRKHVEYKKKKFDIWTAFCFKNWDDHPDYLKKWYKGLKKEKIWWDLYKSDYYIAALCFCYFKFARNYVRLIDKNKGVFKVKSILDIGNGIGCATNDLAYIFPEAKVVGTNIEGAQTRMARKLFPKIKILEKIPKEHFDMIFATDYFEHFQDPFNHLRKVLKRTTPKYLIVANSFTSYSTGHFPEYKDGDMVYKPRSTGRAFNAILRNAGYEAMKLGFWNNRPNVWKKRKN